MFSRKEEYVTHVVKRPIVAVTKTALGSMPANGIGNIFDFTFEDFRLDNYDPHPHIKAAVAV